jgi:hypothetical protein
MHVPQARQPCYHGTMTTRLLPPLTALVPAYWSTCLGALAACLALAACSPAYNWRDYTSPDARYRVTFPAKPSSATRDIDLDGMRVSMTMTAAEVEGATFAVGAAEAPDAARARAAVDAMKLALLRNIGAPLPGPARSAAAAGASAATSTDVDASAAGQGGPIRLVGHFEARGTRFYQVIVIGRGKAVPPEQIEQFLTSFSLL